MINEDFFNELKGDIDKIEYTEDYSTTSREDWHKQRLGKLTASRFDDMMQNDRTGKKLGKTAMSYVYEKVAEILTNAPHLVTSPAMEWGSELESEAISKYEEETGRVVERAGFIEFGELAGGTPDGLIEEDGIIEVKCPYNPANHVETILSDNIPDKYIFQIQGNLMVTGRKWCDYVSYDPRIQEPALRLFIKRVERDEEVIQAIADRIKIVSEIVRLLCEKLK